ncbi:site-specific integrase [Flavobacteriaceae bacterium F89]|uniref:Site-specific integrase n=1 Tax=Cerina litoralis TaxID=2874477 RepID=A0AAE3EV92_9FLAO|nr:tyrosine-type recombinase/integrase [Cerina litoralis]MCG2460824.1 site-specific integrase [Cerina litoralis]
MKITLSPIEHRGGTQIKISFDYDLEVKAYIKQFPGVRWSKTYNSFYIPFSHKAKSDLFQYLREQKFYVDYSALSALKNRPRSPNKIIGAELSGTNKERLNQYRNYLEGRRLSGSTISTYSTFIALMLEYLKETPLTEIDNEKIRLFVEDIIPKKNYGISTHRQLISAVKHFGLLFKETNIEGLVLQRPKKSQYLPSVLSQQEIIDLLRSTTNLKHRATLALLYSAGLRISEIIQLELCQIDIDRRQINIKQAKGRKDRNVMLAESFIPLLANYMATYRPKKYFIEGVNGSLYSPTSIRAFLKKSCKRAGITKRVTPHTLRHSYATHLIENGVGLRHVQELLGHSKPETTMIYTHVAQSDLLSIKSPLDTAVTKLLKTDKTQRNLSLSRNIKG